MSHIRIPMLVTIAIAGLAVSSFPLTGWAAETADADATVRSSCFESLKKEAEDARGMFQEGVDTIANKSYQQIEGGFSRYYKNASSFGIDLDSAIIETRIQSFGKQTGYVHPPMSPFPTSKMTEKWDAPAKEFVLIEEYVTNPEGKRLFLSCGLIRIQAGDELMKVTADRYAYDGSIVSIHKDAGDYRVWYNDNVSYDFNDIPFVNWYRLFVYPKATVNGYFDRYSVLPSFPSNETDSLSKTLGPDTPVGASGTVRWSDRMYFADENGRIYDGVANSKLFPPKLEGYDETFPLYSYYRSINDQFPEFSKHVAYRGVFHFDTITKLIPTADDPKYADVWSAILDSKGIVKSYLKAGGKYDADALASDKNRPVGPAAEMVKNAASASGSSSVGESRLYAQLIPRIAGMETEAIAILGWKDPAQAQSGASASGASAEPAKATPSAGGDSQGTASSDSSTRTAMVFGLVFILVAIVLFVAVKKGGKVPESASQAVSGKKSKGK